MPWNMQVKLLGIANGNDGQRLKAAAVFLGYEFERLKKQKCAYCDGYGHSGNDCPTDHKISHLRGGVLEANRVLTAIRKQCRTEAGMADVTGFSLLSADPNKHGPKKRTRGNFNDTMSEPNGHSFKRLKFN